MALQRWKAKTADEVRPFRNVRTERVYLAYAAQASNYSTMNSSLLSTQDICRALLADMPRDYPDDIVKLAAVANVLTSAGEDVSFRFRNFLFEHPYGAIEQDICMLRFEDGTLLGALEEADWQSVANRYCSQNEMRLIRIDGHDQPFEGMWLFKRAPQLIAEFEVAVRASLDRLELNAQTKTITAPSAQRVRI